MTVSFYLPEEHLPSAEKRDAWLRDDAVVLEESGKSAAAQSWIYRTWIALTRSGCRVGLVHELPRSGWVIALAGTLPADFRATEELFVVDAVADGLPHPAARLHLVQNAAHAQRLPRAIFMPHWPQPGLLERGAGRGNIFERAAFFGTPANLAAELQDPAWQSELARQCGVIFECRGADRWHDYRDVDAVVAIRDFRGGRQIHKPATKLYNAWLAGMPFIGGPDSAYAAEGRAGEDYLVARHPDEVIAHLLRLQSDRAWRDSLVARGREKSARYTTAAITERWRALVEEIIPAAAARRTARPRWAKRCGDLFARMADAADRIFRS